MALLLALMLLVGLSGLAVPTGSEAATAPADPVQVQLESITPITPTPGSTVRVSGRVVNASDRPVRDLAVRLRISGQRVGTRGELAALAKGTTVRDGHVITASTVPLTTTLGPGDSAAFMVSVPADTLGLDAFGVYPIGVEARGRTTTRGSVQLGITRTFLPWMPAGVKPTQVSWLWPLVTAPRRDAEGTLVGDGLVKELSADGRLGRLVAEGAYLPVTWVIDPDLLDTAAALAGSANASAVASPAPTDGASPTTPAPTPEPGTSVEAGIAQQWLGGLVGGTTGSEVVALPYADPDIVAMHRAGLDEDVRGARDQGRTLSQRLLGRFVTGDVAWPAGGLLDQSTADALTERGVGAAIIDPSARAMTHAPSYTPDGRVDIPTERGPLAGLVYDTTLSRLMTTDVSAAGQKALLVQRFLAETAMITAERPADSRTVLIAPPREWSPTPGIAAQLVTTATQAGWITTVPLSTLRGQAPDPGVDRKPLAYPTKARAGELPPQHLQRMRDLESDVTTFSQVLTEPDALLPPYRTAALRLASTHWRGHAENASRLADAIAHDVAALRGSVELVATPVTFGSSTGTFPLTIVNRLDQAVIVDLQISPRTPRLEVRPTEPLTIGAQRREQANITASANAKGLVLVDAQLRTPVGEPLGPIVSFRVAVTQIGTMGLLVTIGAAAVLFVTAGVRIGRRAILARREGSSS